MGTENNRLEMLFICSAERGKGIGKQLLKYGIEKFGIKEVTANEQNPQAVGFYKHMEFVTYKRTDYDEEGNLYPLLYMKFKLYEWGYGNEYILYEKQKISETGFDFNGFVLRKSYGLYKDI